jgi:hypothetical protein
MIQKQVCDYFLTDKKMKAKSLLLFFLVVFISCNTNGVKKPSKLIEEEKMIDILYDMSILDALNSSNPVILADNNIVSRTYIYKKYAIDSLQFIENTTYYAADLKKYKKMYETVENRIIENKKVADSLLKIEQEKEAKNAERKKPLSKDSLRTKKAIEEIKATLKKQN